MAATLQTDFLVIGAGLAGNEAAKTLRRLAPTAAVTMVGAEPHRPYDRPPLSKDFLKGKLPLEKLYLSPPGFYEGPNAVSLLSGVAVTGLDPAAHRATLADGRGIAYRKAFLATGGQPVRLSVPGANLAGVHYLRTLDDACALGAGVAGKTAVIVGGGFIGLELASSITELGGRAILLERGPHIWARFIGPELAAFFQGAIAAKGARILVRTALQEILGRDGRACGVRLESGEEIACDLVCVGIGIVPNLELAKAAGLAVDNGVLVDASLQSSHPDVYAGGDICNFPAPGGRRRRVEHWNHAGYCGRLAAQNMAGQAAVFDNMPFVWSDLFDLKLKFLGDEHEHDATLLRGEPGRGPFTLFYLKGGAVSACFAVDPEAKDLGVLRKVIAAAPKVAGREPQLRDPGASLAQFLA